MNIEQIRRGLLTARGNSWAELYKEYIKSREWGVVRAQVMARAKGKCELCGKKAKAVHHETYERLANEDLGDLIAICTKCHSEAHDIKYVAKVRRSRDSKRVEDLEAELGRVKSYCNKVHNRLLALERMILPDQ